MPKLSRRLAALLLLLTASPLALAAGKKAPPAKPAPAYPASDTHPQEHVTIAADPCTRPEDCSFFRLPYVRHGFIPVRVIISNDSASPLSLDDVRIQFISANHDVLPAASPDELNRRLFSTKSALGTKLPIIPITIHHPPVDKKILEDDTDFGFNTPTVPAHGSVSGYLFYDVRDLDDPPLKNAELYVKEIRSADTKQQLFAFTIPFNKFLASQTGQKPVAKPAPAPPIN